MYRIILLIGVFCLFSQAGWAQNAVTGRVVDENGYGIASVKVVNADGQNLGVTDGKGNFDVDATNEQLVFEHDGYFTKSVNVSDNAGQYVTLRKNIFDRNVGVAYGIQNYRWLTGSVASVSGQDMRKTPSSTLSNTLYGKLPGLTVLQGSGEPGYDAPQMLIRGKATYRNSDFLVFVDGVEESFDQLNVDEIESISVLKDAASLAQFGIRGANGALWVTTKRGQTGKTRITLNARTGIQQPITVPSFLGSYDYARLYNEALSNDGLQSKYSQTALEAYKNGSDPYLYPNVNWYDQVLRNETPMTDFSLTLSGGGDIAKYFVLLGYLDNNGLYANTDSDRKINSNADFRRYNFRSNIDVNVTKAVTASLDLSGRIEDRYFPGINGGALWNNMAKYPPNAYPVRNPNGSWGGNTIYPDNPVASVLDRGYNSTDDNNLRATFRMTEDLAFITPGLKFTQNVSFSNWFRGSYNKTKDYATYELQSAQSGDSLIYIKHGLASDYSISQGGNNQNRRSDIQLALNYDRQFDVHGISGMLMYKQDLYTISGNNVPYAYQNYMGRVNYNYNSRYIAEFGFSYSGSENFPKNHRFGFFPSVSGAWVMSNEGFMQDNKVFDYLKLRASVGLLGNDNIGSRRFPFIQDYYYSGGYHFGRDNNWWGALTEGELANSNVTWEKSLKYNVGVDASLFNKLDLTFDYFFERRTDILADRNASVPSIIGAGLPAENIGKVNNQGFELSLDYNNHIGELAYTLGTSAFYAHNKIKYMNEVPRAEDYLYRTGNSVDQPFGLEAIGFFQDQADIDKSPNQTFGPVQPGDIKYKDQNGDGLINEDDMIAIGKPWEPEITYTFNLGLQFHNFDFQAFFEGITNRDVYTNGPLFWAFVNDSKIASNALGRWTPENSANATYPRLTASPNENNYRQSTFWMKSGDVFRLRNVELGYNIHSSMLASTFGVNDARVYVSGTNLLTWDKMDRVDPETMSGYPAMKSYNVGFRLQF